MTNTSFVFILFIFTQFCYPISASPLMLRPENCNMLYTLYGCKFFKEYESIFDIEMCTIIVTIVILGPFWILFLKDFYRIENLLQYHVKHSKIDFYIYLNILNHFKIAKIGRQLHFCLLERRKNTIMRRNTISYIIMGNTIFVPQGASKRCFRKNGSNGFYQTLPDSANPTSVASGLIFS